MPLDDARDDLIDNQGTQVDSACVAAFLSRWEHVVAIASGSPGLRFHAVEAPLAPSPSPLAGMLTATTADPTRPAIRILPAPAVSAGPVIRLNPLLLDYTNESE